MSGELIILNISTKQASQDPDVLERNANDYPYSSLSRFFIVVPL